MPAKYSQDIRDSFVEKVVSGAAQTTAYMEATGSTDKAASVNAVRWMRLPEIQEAILKKTQAGLLRAGRLSVIKLVEGLEAIKPEEMDNASIKLIEMGMKVSGFLERRIELNVTETSHVDPAIKAALVTIGKQAMADVHDTFISDDGSYEIK